MLGQGRGRPRAWATGLALALAVLCASPSARADPQLGAALTTGAALTDLRASNAPRLAYHLGGRFDVLFARDRAGAMALGPYVDVGTEAFDTFAAGGGVEWLIPTGDPALVVSGGGFTRTSRFGVAPGVEAGLFWGARSFNYHGIYSLALGLFVEGRYGFGDGKEADAIGGVQVDLEYLALPFLFAYEAIAH